MQILLTNDDGIHAQGLWTMEKVLFREHKVFVVAPDKEQSGVAHGITLVNPLRVNRIQTNGGWGFAVNGTPADCVKLGVSEILETQPDMVVSGINQGENVGTNLNYSGTISAAKEATLMGIPAIAVSEGAPHYHKQDVVTPFMLTLINTVMENGLPSGTFLNVNIPACRAQEIKGIRITRQAIAPVRETFHKRVDPRNQCYYWQGIETQMSEEASDTDRGAFSQNYISVTPVQCDLTNYQALEILKEWENLTDLLK